MSNYSVSNVVVDPPFSNLVRVTRDDGVEIAFSLGWMSGCENFSKIFETDRCIYCNCGNDDWYLEKDPFTKIRRMILRSNFHDRRLCVVHKCFNCKLRLHVDEMLSEERFQNYDRWSIQLVNAVRYVLPDVTDWSIIDDILHHKISFDFAIEPLYDIEMNWFNCCSVCGSAGIYAPSVKKELFGIDEKSVWRWKDCPWEKLIIDRLVDIKSHEGR